MHYLLALLAPLAPILVLFRVHRSLVPVKVWRAKGSVTARTNGLIIWHDPAQDYAEAAMAHEWEHVRQCWQLGMVPHWILILCSKRYKTWTEAKAYAESVNHGRPLEHAAGALARTRGLDFYVAREMIREHL